MKLTKKKAIKISRELWDWLAETGEESKADWHGWEKYGKMHDDCALCEYVRTREGCISCPLGQDCYGTYFGNWYKARKPETRKKYAALFVKQLEEL